MFILFRDYYFLYSTQPSDISGREYSDLTVNAAPSCEDISHMIRLCPDYSLLGGRLLDTATSLANERAEGTTLPGGTITCL